MLVNLSPQAKREGYQMAEVEVAYLERRAAAEAELAQRAKCPAAMNAHHQMSRAYFASAAALKQMAAQRAMRRGS
jgi:hypothetical protein